MKITIVAIAAAVLLTGGPARAQENASQAGTGAAKAAPTREQLENAFRSMLTKATMSGRWCSIKEGKLGQEKEDKYSIVSATKAGGDKWFISARIQFNKKEMVVPIPVEVKWAGDTPVLIVDKLQYPGGGTYSARVLFYENTYAGTWSGGDHGGLMNGTITKEKE